MNRSSYATLDRISTDGVIVQVEQAADPLEVYLDRGADLQIGLADGVEDPNDHDVLLMLLESHAWGTVRANEEVLPGRARVRYGRDDRVFDPGPFYSSSSLYERFLDFRPRSATLRGLSPGLWRFKTVPAGVTVEPEFVTLPLEGPLEIRWHRDG